MTHRDIELFLGEIEFLGIHISVYHKVCIPVEADLFAVGHCSAVIVIKDFRHFVPPSTVAGAVGGAADNPSGLVPIVPFAVAGAAALVRAVAAAPDTSGFAIVAGVAAGGGTGIGGGVACFGAMNPIINPQVDLITDAATSKILYREVYRFLYNLAIRDLVVFFSAPLLAVAIASPSGTPCFSMAFA